MDKAEQQDTLKDINSLIEELGYLDSFAEDKGELELLRHIEIADVALRNAKATLEKER